LPHRLSAKPVASGCEKRDPQDANDSSGEFVRDWLEPAVDDFGARQIADSINESPRNELESRNCLPQQRTCPVAF